METPDVPLSPTHIEETIGTITQLHAEHRQAATPFERGVDFVTALLGRPCFIAVLTGFIFFWVGGNLFPLWYPAFDPPPFSGLGSALSVVSVYLVILILIAQRRDDELALHREQLILELVISSEQKTAKIIQLLEEFRRDTGWEAHEGTWLEEEERDIPEMVDHQYKTAGWNEKR